MIQVIRTKDGKIFTSDMSKFENIIEIHFCTSYTQVIIQEKDEDNKLQLKDIICNPIGTESDFIDMIAVQSNDVGKFI